MRERNSNQPYSFNSFLKISAVGTSIELPIDVTDGWSEEEKNSLGIVCRQFLQILNFTSSKPILDTLSYAGITRKEVLEMIIEQQNTTDKKLAEMINQGMDAQDKSPTYMARIILE
ncbi:hypothetical protein HYS97_02020 [Candidatus Daviesbacteria bacterium]|nr:hypothetical protein [Candidatus Daviesbacteria bacterium]